MDGGEHMVLLTLSFLGFSEKGCQNEVLLMVSQMGVKVAWCQVRGSFGLETLQDSIEINVHRTKQDRATLSLLRP